MAYREVYIPKEGEPKVPSTSSLLLSKVLKRCENLWMEARTLAGMNAQLEEQLAAKDGEIQRLEAEIEDLKRKSQPNSVVPEHNDDAQQNSVFEERDDDVQQNSVFGDEEIEERDDDVQQNSVFEDEEIEERDDDVQPNPVIPEDEEIEDDEGVAPKPKGMKRDLVEKTLPEPKKQRVKKQCEVRSGAKAPENKFSPQPTTTTTIVLPLEVEILQKCSREVEKGHNWVFAGDNLPEGLYDMRSWVVLFLRCIRWGIKGDKEGWHLPGIPQADADQFFLNASNTIFYKKKHNAGAQLKEIMLLPREYEPIVNLQTAQEIIACIVWPEEPEWKGKDKSISRLLFVSTLLRKGLRFISARKLSAYKDDCKEPAPFKEWIWNRLNIDCDYDRGYDTRPAQEALEMLKTIQVSPNTNYNLEGLMTFLQRKGVNKEALFYIEKQLGEVMNPPKGFWRDTELAIEAVRYFVACKDRKELKACCVVLTTFVVGVNLKGYFTLTGIPKDSGVLDKVESDSRGTLCVSPSPPEEVKKMDRQDFCSEYAK